MKEKNKKLRKWQLHTFAITFRQLLEQDGKIVYQKSHPFE